MGSFFRIRFSLNQQEVMDSLLDYTQDKKRRILVHTPGSGTVPKNCECWWMKLSTETLDDCKLMSNCIPEFQQSYIHQISTVLCVSVGVPFDTWINFT
jgi:hypothetical protein